MQHIPDSHFVLFAGDFNSPLQQCPPHVQTFDPKYDRTAQTDKHVFQQMVQDLQFIAMQCSGPWTPILLHGDHATRIDFMFIRRGQR